MKERRNVMGDNAVEILGLTSQEEISKYNLQYPYKEFTRSYTISLVDEKLKIGQILKVFLKPQISGFKYIFTQGQYKIFMEGSINIRILFLQNPYDTDIYSTEINKIISGFLPVENSLIDSLKPTMLIEDAFVAPLTKNKFSLSLLIAMGTILETDNKYTEDYTENYTKVVDTVENFELGTNLEKENYSSSDEEGDLEEEPDNENLEEQVEFEEVTNLKEEESGSSDEETDLEEKPDNENLEEQVEFEEVTNSKEEESDSPDEETDLEEEPDNEVLGEEVEFEEVTNLKEEESSSSDEETDLEEEPVNEILGEEVEFEEVTNLKEEESSSSDEEGDLEEEPDNENLGEEVNFEEVTNSKEEGSNLILDGEANLEEMDIKNLGKSKNSGTLDETTDLKKETDTVMLEEVNNEILQKMNSYNLEKSQGTEKLKENSINIDVEYDMNSGEEFFK